MKKPMRRYKADILPDLQRQEIETLGALNAALRSQSVDDADLWTMLLCTVRYAMGRSTCITAIAADLVRQFRSRLTAEQIAQIAREVRQALEFEEGLGRTLGHDMDHRGWKKLVADLTAKESA